MKLVFIRHGLSVANKTKVISGSKDVPLSEEGKQLLLEIKEDTVYPKTEYNVVTTLSRTKETFELLFPNEKIDKTEARLAEISFGDYEGCSFDSINLDELFKQIYHNEVVCNNETISELYSRVEEALIDLINELNSKNLSSATIVAHSTVIRIIAVKAIKDDYDTFKSIKPKNGKGFIIDAEVQDGKLIFNSCESL